MVEVRPGSMRRSLGVAGLLALWLATGCATSDGFTYGPDRARHRELMAAQRARRDLGQTTPASPTPGEKLSEGDQLRSAGDPQRALFRYLEAHRLDPADPTARERIAYIHLEEDPDRARSIFEEVLVEDPTSVNAQLGLGLSQLALGRLELAQASLERARALNPNSPEVLSALGSVYDRLGLHDQARAELEHARALSPHDPRILNNLGVAHLIAGNAALAEAALRESVLQNPRDKAARNNLGLALGLSGRYPEALASFREAGSEQAAQNNIGYCYFLKERYSEAIAHYEKALMAEGDDDLTILRNLANAREAEQEGARQRASLPQSPAQPQAEAAAEASEVPVQPAVEQAEHVEAPDPSPTARQAAPEATPTRPSESAPSAAPEPIVILSEIVDETSAERVDAAKDAEATPPEAAPARREPASGSGEGQEATEPAGTDAEQSVSQTRPGQPAPTGDPAAPAP